MQEILGLENINESLQTHFLIYKITNTINGKYYIGQHKTNDPYDDYMGSGDYIKSAEQKYGLSAFAKEILFDFDNFEEMNAKEAELVQLSCCFPYNQMSYNLVPGGHSPIMFGENNPAFGKNPFRNKSQKWHEQYLQMMHNINTGKNNPRYGHSFFEKMSQEEYNKMIMQLSESHKGKKNSQYGVSPKERMSKETYKKWKEKCKLNSIGKNNPCYGRKWMFNPTTKDKVYPKLSECQKYLDHGYIFGTGKKYDKCCVK